METKSFIIVLVVVLLILGAGVAGWFLRGGQIEPPAPPKKSDIEVQIPGNAIEGPAKIITKRINVPVEDTAAIAKYEHELSQARAERDAALARVARYEQLWVEYDTTLRREARVVAGDSLLSTHFFREHLNIRYGYVPINRFVLHTSDNVIEIPIALPEPYTPDPQPIKGYFENAWDGFSTTSAWIVLAEIAGLMAYILLK